MVIMLGGEAVAHKNFGQRAVAPSRSAAWPLTGSLDPPKAADGDSRCRHNGVPGRGALLKCLSTTAPDRSEAEPNGDRLRRQLKSLPYYIERAPTRVANAPLPFTLDAQNGGWLEKQKSPERFQHSCAPG